MRVIKLENVVNLKNAAIDVLNSNHVHDLTEPKAQSSSLVPEIVADTSVGSLPVDALNHGGRVPLSSEGFQTTVTTTSDSNDSLNVNHIETSEVSTGPSTASISHEFVPNIQADMNINKNGITDILTGDLIFHQKADGRHYSSGIILKDSAVKILLALNRGNDEYKSKKYDGKFAATLIQGMAGIVDLSVRRNFLLGLYIDH